MYKDKGTIKVFNGSKFKTVSYMKEEETIIFCTDKTSNKYKEFTKESKLVAKEENKEVQYDCEIIEDEKTVDVYFAKLRKVKAIPFFIPRKNKIIVKYVVK